MSRQAGFGGLLARLGNLTGAVAALWIAQAAPAQAHPHVFIDLALKAEIAPSPQGGAQLMAVEVIWTFDELYSFFSIEELPKLGPEQPDPDAVSQMADFAAEALEEWNYYLDLRRDDQRQEVGVVSDFTGVFENGRLIYSYRLPFPDPIVLEGSPLTLRIYDPVFYVAISPDPKGLSLSGADLGCSLTLAPAPGLSEEQTFMGMNLPEQDVAPGEEGLGFPFAAPMILSCP
ncbi:MAG: DUF1007 family protein [Rhodospirillaceae bacterium]